MYDMTPRPDDIFSVRGYSPSDITGAMLNLPELSSRLLRESLESAQQVGASAAAASQGQAKASWLEIYFGLPDFSDPAQPLASVLYFNQPALRLCVKYDLALPAEREILRRSELPPNLGTFVTFPVFES